MIHNGSYIVLDLETGGKDYKSNPVVEFSCIVLDYLMKEVSRFETFIKPYDNLIITEEALNYNKISETDIMSGMTVQAFHSKLVQIFKENKQGRYNKPVLVGHNIVDFDIFFLEKIFKICDDDIYNYVQRYLEDTLWLSRKKWGHIDVIDHKLASLCERLGIIVTDTHRASNDTDITAKAFIHFIQETRGMKVSKGEVEEEYKRKFQF